MRVFGGWRGVNRDVASRQSGVKGLKKSEMIADLFNNKEGEGEEKQSVKLRLSHASRALISELRKNVHDLIQSHSSLASALDAVEFPDEEWSSPSSSSDLSVRKVAAYLRWKELGSPQEGSDGFEAISAAGADEEIQKIFEENWKKHEELRSMRSSTAPNYYYLVYPETYSFN